MREIDEYRLLNKADAMRRTFEHSVEKRALDKVALLLEDEALIAIDIESMLTDEGYQVVTFATCSEALIWLREHSPAIAIVDVRLRDGACNPVARLLTERRIPFVVHSAALVGGFASDPEFAAGVWLNKPSADGEMLVSISRAIGAAT
ncbi:MAG: response regulator [Devosia sp.]